MFLRDHVVQMEKMQFRLIKRHIQGHLDHGWQSKHQYEVP